MSQNYNIHYKTSNESFIQMHFLLKDLGIKNNRFFLALYDSQLEEVDPHRDDLDIFTRGAILKELSKNPWYYIREVCRLIAPGQPKGMKFSLHRGNLASIWCALNDISQILLMPRQHGKSIGTVSIMQWITYFGTTNTKMVFFNKKFSDSKLNLLRLTEIVDLWPEWLKVAVKDTRNDKDNVERVLYFKRQNYVDASPSPTSKDTADKLG